MAGKAQVTNIQATTYPESVAIRLTWDAYPKAVSYLVQYAVHAIPLKWVNGPTIKPPKIEAIISKLKPGVTYDVRVIVST